MRKQDIQPGPAFRRALEAARPTVGGAGYPAALGYSDTDLDWLRSITLADFERATSPLGRDVEYVLVHNMRRVIGPWEEADHAER